MTDIKERALDLRKKGLPVKYKNSRLDYKSIDIDRDKVEYVQYWVEASKNEIVYCWKDKE